MILKEFFTGYKGKDLPPELKDFNWGALLLTFIWGIKHRAWITLLAIPLIWFQLPLGINWILYTLLQLYCGFKGNMWAYQVDWWMSPKQFRKTQARWAFFAISLHILIPFLILGITVQFIKKSPDNPEKFIRNAQCRVAYEKLDKGFQYTSINSTITTNEIAQNFAKQFKNATPSGDQVNFNVKLEGKNVELYSIKFEKYGQDDFCNIQKQNCIITSDFILPAEVGFANHCTFFFDYNKNFIPDEETSKAIEKGYNILKYL